MCQPVKTSHAFLMKSKIYNIHNLKSVSYHLRNITTFIAFSFILSLITKINEAMKSRPTFYSFILLNQHKRTKNSSHCITSNNIATNLQQWDGKAQVLKPSIAFLTHLDCKSYEFNYNFLDEENIYLSYALVYNKLI